MTELASFNISDTQMEDNQARKRFKIAIEPIEEKRVFTITGDGQERIKPYAHYHQTLNRIVNLPKRSSFHYF
jgi:hypothetical protein